MDRTSQGLKIVIRNCDGTSSDITMYSDDGRMPSTIEIGGGMKTADLEVSGIEDADDEPFLKKKSVDDNDSAEVRLWALSLTDLGIVKNLTLVLAIQEDPVGCYLQHHPRNSNGTVRSRHLRDNDHDTGQIF